ncbi:MAG: amylo-alpha-1,6-glucosidase [Symploca sp. SIO2E6]|nr:amylo-alpha-1,6-glucosidase [Symploca sp. SIO2E6]
MKELDSREWLLTNGLGSFASGTVCDARTRTYHGWLVASLEPPGHRTLLLSHLDASLELADATWALSTNFWDGGKQIEPNGYQLLQSFALEPVPSWVWGSQEWQLTRRLVMPYGLVGEVKGIGNWEQGNDSQDTPTSRQFCNRILVQYQYEGSEVATLRLRPLIADRDFHHQQSATEGLQFSQLVLPERIYLQGIRPNVAGVPWQLRWSRGYYQPEGVWYWNYYYPEENLRGLNDYEDLYSPGYLSVMLYPGEAVTLEARVGWSESPIPQLHSQSFEQAVAEVQARHNQLFSLVPVTSSVLEYLRGNKAEGRGQKAEGKEQVCKVEGNDNRSTTSELMWRKLLRAGEQFIAYRASIDGPTVIAGYPWFSDWGRDTLIALPGLALATGQFALAKGLLQTFGSYCRHGLIPNTFPDKELEPTYNSIDASLWWIETLGLYLEATQDWDFLNQQYPIVREIYKAHTAGSLYNIRVDAADGLLIWDAPQVALTWMDVVIDGEPVTPRRGKPVEINALWYSALCWISKWTEKLVSAGTTDSVRLLDHAQHYAEQAQQVKASLPRFWHPEQGYFFDTIEPDDRRNTQIRPNAVLALSLYHCGFPKYQGQSVLQVACDRLLTPYGLRSLDPADPDYIGNYSGNRWHRDSAYHQGTVWSWLIGPFIRAWQRFYPTETIPWDSQPLLEHFQQQVCIGSISEIFDGDPPHAPQGAIAQGWSVAELIRHF